MQVFVAALFAALALSLSPTAAAFAPPVVEDPYGGTPWSCRWNPYAYIIFDAGIYYWVGRFEWYDPPGNPTGIPCV